MTSRSAPASSRWLAEAGLILLGICPQLRVDAQQDFSRRYDVFGQQYDQTGFGIELADSGRFIAFLASEWQDSIWYSSVVTTVLIDVDGTPLQEHRVEYPWRVSYPGWANGNFPLQQGGYALGGHTYDNTIRRPTLFFFNAYGAPDSLIEYGVNGQNWIGRQAKQTPDGGFVICGETSSVGGTDAFIISVDAQGNEQWVQTYGGPLVDFAVAIDTAEGGELFLGGALHVTSTNYQLWVLRLDSSGGIVWQKTWGSSYDEPDAHLETLQDGHALVASAWGFGTNWQLRPYLAKLDKSDGSIIWDRTYGATAYNATFFTGKEVNPSGDIIAAGYSYAQAYLKGILLRTNSNGDSLWFRYYHYYDSLWTAGEGAFRDVMPTPDGGFIAVGTAYGSNNPNDPPIYGQDLWVVKVDSMGCIEPGCNALPVLDTQITNLREALKLWPNPVHGTLNLSWQLPVALGRGSCQLSVVGPAGQLVRTEPIDLSRSEFQIDVRDLSPGLYHVHLVKDGTWVTGGKFGVE